MTACCGVETTAILEAIRRIERGSFELTDATGQRVFEPLTFEGVYEGGTIHYR
ncbi:MAG: hypothetical protein OXU20_05200 [Myxococcales bacterium]|nr:hypothetical protein [Myxococcales bacterium]